MRSHSLPSSPAEENNAKKSAGTSAKPSYRASKRTSNDSAAPSIIAGASGMDGRHKRVWKACERCRIKKTKCEGELPCKRCKNDSLVCTAVVQKKMKYKQLRRGYAEVLENTQLSLIATIHKLYSMVRSSQPWKLDEPDLNDRGQPVVHSIAQKLGCILRNCDISLPVHSVFPEDESSLVELARQLNEQQPHEQEASAVVASSTGVPRDVEFSAFNRTDRALSSNLEHSNIEQNYPRRVLGGHNALSLSPRSYASGSDFQFSTTPADIDAGATFSMQSSSMPDFASPWPAAPQAQPHQQQQPSQHQQQYQYQQQSPNIMFVPFMQQPDSYQSLVMTKQNALDVEIGTIKPDISLTPTRML